MSRKEKPGANTWRNPLFVENAGAARIAASLTQGAELRRRVTTGFALGTFVIESPVPTTVSALALAGFDFLVLDMEHSSVDFTRLELLLSAAHAAGIATLVRPWGEDVGLIALDDVDRMATWAAGPGWNDDGPLALRNIRHRLVGNRKMAGAHLARRSVRRCRKTCSGKEDPT